ncbi:paired domain-containing protein [Trichonephila clavipes]|nr:paired domain-containing protein [Trichonephila clavipes]
MAPKTKEISLDMRKHITELCKEGKSFQKIGKIFKLSFTTVGYIIKKYLETGSVENKPRPGGPRKLTSRAKRMIHNLLDSAKKLSMENTFIFQQDNDPKHNPIVTKTWLLYHDPRWLETPPQSPDLNPIENLWMHLDTEVPKKM